MKGVGNQGYFVCPCPSSTYRSMVQLVGNLTHLSSSLRVETKESTLSPVPWLVRELPNR